MRCRRAKHGACYSLQEEEGLFGLYPYERQCSVEEAANSALSVTSYREGMPLCRQRRGYRLERKNGENLGLYIIGDAGCIAKVKATGELPAPWA